MPKNSWRTQELTFGKEFLTKKVVKKIQLKKSWRTQELGLLVRNSLLKREGMRENNKMSYRKWLYHTQIPSRR